MTRQERSSRPIWLGDDSRGWDHIRLHVQALHDDRLAGAGLNLGFPSPAKAFTLAVYQGLAAHAELQTGDARPAAETLAGYVGCDERTVRRSLRVLEAVGYIEIIRRPGLASVYRLLPPPALDTPDSESGVDVGGADPQSGGSGPSVRTGADSQSDEQEPLNENHERDVAHPDLHLPARAADVEAEADDRGLGGEALGLIVRHAEARLGAGRLASVFCVTDTGGRLVLERRLAELLDGGWPLYDLVDELADSIRDGARSPVAVLLDRARQLGPVPPDVAHRADAVDELRSRRLDSVRRHAQVLAASCSTHQELLNELCAYYGDDGDALEAAFAAADLDERGRLRDHAGAAS